MPTSSSPGVISPLASAGKRPPKVLSAGRDEDEDEGEDEGEREAAEGCLLKPSTMMALFLTSNLVNNKMCKKEINKIINDNNNNNVRSYGTYDEKNWRRQDTQTHTDKQSDKQSDRDSQSCYLPEPHAVDFIGDEGDTVSIAMGLWLWLELLVWLLLPATNVQKVPKAVTTSYCC